MDDPARQRLLPSPEEPSQIDPNKLGNDVKEFETILSKALTNVLHSSANLANMLPTGTVLFFQMLDPVLLRAGSCENKVLSAVFLIVCSFVCFVLSFTDSFQAPNGKVYYGLATIRGLWTPQLESFTDLPQFRLRFADFVHAILAVIAFMTTTSFSTDVISCFVEVPDSFVRAAPAISGFLVSAVFVNFPTPRHGIGFPLTPLASVLAAAPAGAPIPASAPATSSSAAAAPEGGSNPAAAAAAAADRSS